MWKRYLVVAITVMGATFVTNRANAVLFTANDFGVQAYGSISDTLRESAQRFEISVINCNPFPSSASAYTVSLRSGSLDITFTPRSLSTTSCNNYQDFSNIGYGTAWATLDGNGNFHGACRQTSPDEPARCSIHVPQETLDGEPITLIIYQPQLVVECEESGDSCTVTDTFTIHSPSIDISSLFDEGDPLPIVDTDGDTVADDEDPEAPLPPGDSDGDGITNDIDTDDDADGLVDGVDPCVLVAGACENDTDGDGVSNVADSCDGVADLGIDADSDGLDAACDADDANGSFFRDNTAIVNDFSICTENCGDDDTLDADGGGGGCSLSSTNDGNFLSFLFAALGLLPLAIKRGRSRMEV